MNAAQQDHLQALVAQELSKLDTSYHPPATEVPEPIYGPYHKAAAVLASFDPTTIQPVGEPSAPDRVEALLVDSTPVLGSRERGRWSLLPIVRREVLRFLGSRHALQAALATNAQRPENMLQRMLEAYIEGNALPLEQQNAAEVAATFQVVEWLSGVLTNLPTPEQVRLHHERLNLLQPFENLAGRHFRGREAELQILRDYVGVLPPNTFLGSQTRIAEEVFGFHERPALMIYGLGGVGKSTLLARFILEHATLPDTERFPWVYLDFDRPGLRPEEPVTLLAEATRQLAAQYPTARSYCDSMRADMQEWLERQSNRATTRPNAKTTRRSSSEGNRFLRDFARLLSNLKVEQAPFLLVLDTFEEVQYRSNVIMAELGKFLSTFQKQVPRLRTILVGRASVSNAIGFPIQEVPLAELDAEAAQGFLESQGVAPPDLARTFAGMVGGNPLNLHLAVSVWRAEGAEGITALHRRSLLGLRLQQSEIRGWLYDRILEHIHVDEIRKLAHPGLVLRRLTPDIIRRVLAVPCEVAVPDDETAQRYFEALKLEVALVTFEDGVLRHRPDVRLAMLRLLRDEQPEKTREIDEAAVTYYLQHEYATSRAEEIYHRLALHQPTDVVEERWMEGVQQYLFGAVEELDPHEQAWLAARLGLSLDSTQLDLANLDGWERDAKRRATELLARNRAQDALAALRERSQRTPGSRLFALEAQAWEDLGDLSTTTEQRSYWLAARHVIELGLASADASADRVLALDLRLAGAPLARLLGELDGAARWLNEASDLANTPNDAPRLLEIALERLTLQRMVGNTVQDFSAISVALRTQFESLTDQQVASNPELMGQLAKELGTSQLEVLWRIVRLTGLETSRQTLLRALARALADWDLDASSAAGTEPGVLARTAGVPLSVALGDSWTAYVLAAPQGTLSQLFNSLLASFAPPPSVAGAVADILRDRVEKVPPSISVDRPLEAADPETARLTPEYAAVSLGRLTSQQFEQFRDALLDAFPTRERLAIMLRFRLDRNLDAIVLAGSMEQIGFQLIQTSQAEGWSAQLLVAARESNPENVLLQTFAAQFGLSADPTVSNSNFERVIGQNALLFDPGLWRSRLGRIETQVCRVELETSSGRAYGTGFLIAPDVVMTAFHVIESLQQSAGAARRVVLRFDYKTLSDGLTVNPGVLYALTEDWLIDSSPYSPVDLEAAPGFPPEFDQLDYALLRVVGTPGHDPVGGERAEYDAAPRGWINVLETAPSLRPGSPLMIVYHPARAPLKLAVDGSGIIGLNENGTRVRYHINTEPGAGGAPCFDYDWKLIAVHHARHDSPNSPPMSQYSQGVPLTAIRALWEKRGIISQLGLEASKV